MAVLSKTIIAGFAAALIALTGGSVLAADIQTGTFVGASNHTTTGTVEVARDDQGYFVKLGSDFSLDGAPDPSVGFGNNGTFVEGTEVGQLRSLTGEQVYRVPASLNPSEFSEVYIWCGRFSVPLGVAELR